MLNNTTQCPRGSEWRKWDLHVHTKGTNKNDQFKSQDFDKFCETLFKEALENDIHVIGITDYFSIENYKKVKNYIDKIDDNVSFTDDAKNKIKDIFLVPNVELRMLPVTDSGRLVNIHCLFNPEYIHNLDNDFFGSVEFSSNLRKYKMNKSGMIALGGSLDSTLNSDDAKYKKGCENFVVSVSDLQKIHDENIDFRENTIFVVSNSNKDGASAFQSHYDLFEEVDSSSLDGVRKSIYCLSDGIFSSNKNDREYFLGRKKDSIETVINKCGSLKPCIHGSDAHTESKLFKPDNSNYCWIKADHTFEGLKQIIFEPEERVKIQEERPDQNKLDNRDKIIESIKFIKQNNSETEKMFPETEILLNPYLTTIIGGKSSGKSALGYFIAKTVLGSNDINKISEKIKNKEEISQSFENYNSLIKGEYIVNVSWLDGLSTSNILRHLFLFSS